MSDDKNKTEESPIVKIAGMGAGASVGIAALAFLFLRVMSDMGIFAVALAIAAPSAMAFGICTAMIKNSKPPQ